MIIKIEQNQKLMKNDKALKSSTITYKKTGQKRYQIPFIYFFLYRFMQHYCPLLLSFLVQ